jgi:hypothetical protein
MKVFIRILLSAAMVIFLSSCIRMVYIGKRIDPEIILQHSKHDIVFVNLFDYMQPANVAKNEMHSYNTGVMNFLDGLSSFSNDSSFKFIVADTLRRSVEEGLLTTLLPVDTISAVCARYNSNLMLTLDSVNIFFEQDTVVNDDYGREYFTINFLLNTRFFLSLYSSEGDLINRSEVDQSANYLPRSTLSGLYILLPTIPRADREIASLAFQAGQDYVAKFYPQIVQDSQQLYTGSTFTESNKYIFEKNWKKAIELLEQLTKSKDNVIAEKARHNLEVAKEASAAEER